MELLGAQVSISILVKKAVDDLDHMRIYLLPNDPVGNLDELVPGDSLVFGIEEEHGPFKISSTEEDVIESQEGLKTDAQPFLTLELQLHLLNHLLLLLPGFRYRGRTW